ncbi:uncharacterized protein PADG_11523 [Paracoccidioides brasiliensis Pb18]|uniref:Uncharacterized protein n=2 Tax=Paracoccidioides brasiliensis TaxID=121759 RepID=A0A0A0HVF4_PARBD|nr:uncharacterized protein PADG_11523 [Paracoccidioides brasiliensis Pb18]KGM92328.1 hypothetical protein PADG_11523 [Paracoccidioides brasiliensis Pb18]ODH25958.1 hypothetical protein ACO22_04909 [Paracoccidioides brasiliensis]
MLISIFEGMNLTDLPETSQTGKHWEEIRSKRQRQNEQKSDQLAASPVYHVKHVLAAMNIVLGR